MRIAYFSEANNGDVKLPQQRAGGSFDGQQPSDPPSEVAGNLRIIGPAEKTIDQFSRNFRSGGYRYPCYITGELQ
jgi:hypothetical protein